MEAIFEWFVSLNRTQMVLLPTFIALIMAVIPFTRQILAFFRSFFGTREPQIHFFRYSFSGFYDQKNEQEEFFLEGTRIQFNWKVSNVRRVDLEPVGRYLSGEKASSVITRDVRLYVLKAYGFFGKMTEANIEIPVDRFRRMAITELTACTHLFRDLPQVSIQSFTKDLPNTHPIRRELPATCIKIFRNDVYIRHRGKPNLNKFIFPGESRQLLYRRLMQAKLLKGLRFSPRRYDEVLDQVRNALDKDQTKTSNINLNI